MDMSAESMFESVRGGETLSKKWCEVKANYSLVHYNFTNKCASGHHDVEERAIKNVLPSDKHCKIQKVMRAACDGVASLRGVGAVPRSGAAGGACSVWARVRAQSWCALLRARCPPPRM